MDHDRDIAHTNQASMFTPRFQADSNIFRKVVTAIETAIPSPYRERVLRSYRLNESCSEGELLSSLTELLTDFIWYLPTAKIIDGLGFSKRAHCSTYFFHQVKKAAASTDVQFKADHDKEKPLFRSLPRPRFSRIGSCVFAWQL